MGKKYLRIGTLRLMNVEVIFEGEVIYSGPVENAPQEIKMLEYTRLGNGSPIKIYVENQ